MKIGFLPFLCIFLACEKQQVRIAPSFPETTLERVRFFPTPVSSQINSSWDQSPICQQNKFCWQNPLLTGLPLNRFWGSHPDSIWAVGEQGTILFFDGTKWSAQISPTSDSLQVIWGMDDTHVWAIGEEGAFIFFDGTKWSLLPSLDFSRLGQTPPYKLKAKSMGGTGPNDIWMVSDNFDKKLAHYNGKYWDFPSPGDIFPRFLWPTSLWSDGKKLWLATGQTSNEPAKILLWDGSTWTESFSQTQPEGAFLHIAGIDEKHIWAVGYDGVQENVIYAFDGTSWNLVVVPKSGLAGTALQQILPFSSKDVWVLETSISTNEQESLLWHFDGNTWSKQDKSIEEISIYGFSSADLWLLGPQTALLQNQLFHFNGKEIKLLTQNIFADGTSEKLNRFEPVVSAFWSADGKDLWALSYGMENSQIVTKILRGDGQNWRVAYKKLGILNTIWGTTKNDIWFGGSFYILVHFDGTTWTDGVVQGAGSSRYVDSRNLHQINSLWGKSQNNIWAVGEDGLILHYDGKIWTKISSGTDEVLVKIWGFDENNIWAVGYNNTLLHYNGITWQPEIGMIPLHFDLYSLWGVSEKQSRSPDWQCLYLVGSEILGTNYYEKRGLLLQGCKLKDQAQFSWSRINYEGKDPTLAQNDTLMDIWLDSTSNIWAVGYKGEILHSDGKTWNIESPAGQLPALFSVWGLSNQQLWFGGRQGTILRLKNK